MSKIESLGYDCRYASTKKKGWKDIDPDTDFVVIAGGDGTVRKVVKKLLDKKILSKRFPVALLPLGTANNISKSLGIEGEPEQLAGSWKKQHIKKIDIGFLQGLNEADFFLESFGYGLFPTLMEKMKSTDEKLFLSLDTEINYSLQVLHDLISTSEAEYLQLQIDGVDRSGKYLLAEIMNIRSIGPNLQLAPGADPSDGELDVVLIDEGERETFASYVLNKLKGVEDPYAFKSIKAKTIHFHANNSHIHVDDELIWLDEPSQITIEVYGGLLEIFTPGKK